MYYNGLHNFFLTEPVPGCPSYEEFATLPIEINGSCSDICAVNTTISYVCDQSSSIPVGYAACTEHNTWYHFHLPETCTPASE